MSKWDTGAYASLHNEIAGVDTNITGGTTASDSGIFLAEREPFRYTEYTELTPSNTNQRQHTAVANFNMRGSGDGGSISASANYDIQWLGAIMRDNNGQIIPFGSIDLVARTFPTSTAEGMTIGSASTFDSIPTSNPFEITGDLNGDGQLTNGDIAPFVQALTDPAGYASTFPDLDPDQLGDFTGDGLLTNGDIAGFVDALTGGGTASVPEPASLALLAIGGLLVARRRR